MVMLEPPLVRLMLDPATNVDADGADILTDPFPAPTVAPAIPENARTFANVPEVDTIPEVLPEADNDTVPPAPPVAPDSVMELPLAVPDNPPVNEMLSPVTIVNVPVPAVFPVMLPLIVEKFTTAGVDADRMIVFPLVLIAPLKMPAPEMTSELLKVPVTLPVESVLPAALIVTVEKFVTLGVVAEIVIEPAPTPTLTIPAPELLS